jgi:hypothetical protein
MNASFPEKFELSMMAGQSSSKKPKARQLMSSRILYRRVVCGVMVILAMAAAAAPGSGAQEMPQLKRPHAEEPEQKPVESKKKKVKGPRAVGILQLSNGKATLIPVAIQVDGKFYDASVYKAEPVPMALEGGAVYEAEQAGESQGLFTTAGALHSQAQGSANPWIGTGSYFPNGTEAAKTTRKAEDVPVGLDGGGDEPPRLTRKPAATSGASAAPPASGSSGKETSEKSGGNVPAAPGPLTGSAGGDGAKGAGSGSDKTADEGGKKPSTTAEPGTGGPAGTGKATSGAPAQADDSGNYYRPTLRRGKPTQAAPEEEPAAAVVTAGSPTGSANASAKPVQVMLAVSDAGGPAPESYKFFWKEGEEEERRKQMLTLAGEEVRAYLGARAKGAIGVKPPASSKTGVGSRKTAIKPAEPIFENIQFRAFDVWRNGQPVMILSADAHFAATPATTTAPETYSVTLVSRTDIYGSLRKLYSGVTDKFHLDVTPRLELIDAVDADGDGRGELLFRQTTDAGKGYVIYRATGDKLWKMFDNLGAE